MKLSKCIPKIFTLAAVLGVGTTVALAVEETPKALRLIEEAGAMTKREKINACWKCYIPALASGFLTVVAIVVPTFKLTRENAKLALAYGVSQTALRLYSDKTTPEVRQQIATVSAEAYRQGETIALKPEEAPEDEIVQWRDYISDQEFHATYSQVKWAVKSFNKNILQVEGKGSINEFYEKLCFTELQPIGDNGDRLGWKYTSTYPEIIPIRYAGFTKKGIPCAILDFVNPPQYGFDTEFA